MTEGLLGPKRSKTDIDVLENWLKANCCEKMRVDEILERWQYLTGHEPRKTMQYLKAIARAEKIKLFRNDGLEYCIWAEGHTATSRESIARPKLSDIIDRLTFKQKMQEGPCAHDCLHPEATDCAKCSRFLSLKNRDFLEE